ncbi:MAG: hypothetical protein ACRDV9_13195 [Acidimicrobiia bacterium]
MASGGRNTSIDLHRGRIGNGHQLLTLPEFPHPLLEHLSQGTWFVAPIPDGPPFATTRSDWKELKESKDAVRDPFLSISTDAGTTWSEATKIHDDGFKISGCPDISAGLAVVSDTKGRHFPSPPPSSSIPGSPMGP